MQSTYQHKILYEVLMQGTMILVLFDLFYNTLVNWFVEASKYHCASGCLPEVKNNRKSQITSVESGRSHF